MQQVVLGIKNIQKAQALLKFLEQLDFIEIIRSSDGLKIKDDSSTETDETLEQVLLNAPVLSEEEIDNIERIGKGISNWEIKEF